MIRVVLLAHKEGKSVASVLLQLKEHLTATGAGFRVMWSATAAQTTRSPEQRR
jgi:hypothetical protein